MKNVIQHEKYGQIQYEESLWTGKKTITVNGTPLAMVKKNVYLYENTQVTLKGNFLYGAKLLMADETVALIPPAAWYEYACSILIFCLVLIWGNNPSLCNIIPVVGGAIGGGISGAMAALNLAAMRSAQKLHAKLGIWLGMLVVTFSICVVIAYLLIAAIN